METSRPIPHDPSLPAAYVLALLTRVQTPGGTEPLPAQTVQDGHTFPTAGIPMCDLPLHTAYLEAWVRLQEKERPQTGNTQIAD